MHHRVSAAVMLAELMDLGVAVVATGNAIGSAGFFNLLIFEPAVFKALFLESGVEETAATATTEIVGPIGLHVDKIFFKIRPALWRSQSMVSNVFNTQSFLDLMRKILYGRMYNKL